ncbi:hypothetical protein KP509_39G043200 [Ceratopteris richardii]|uniref:Uncharacterized protein n=1 Tax=Ceratopteris richardii TaxID=49495 RepID=A0A8T2Q027_CERRI|nr:hypothetical protein KP509_39G043200 [Ceratopteris richardii]
MKEVAIPRLSEAAPTSSASLPRINDLERDGRSLREHMLNASWERRRGQAMDRRRMSMRKDSSLHGHDRMRRSISYASGLTESVICHAPGTKLCIETITDDDFDELKGCIELGFSLEEGSASKFAHILPALPACYDLPFSPRTPQPVESPTSPSSWNIIHSDYPVHDVKEKLRQWAQAVACSAKLCQNHHHVGRS